MLNFQSMNLTELRKHYNQRLAEHGGSLTGFFPIKKFPSHERGAAQCEALEAAIQEIRPLARPKRNDPSKPTVTQLTQQFNDMVPEALALGIKGFRVVGTNFEKHDAAQRRIAQITSKIAEAKAAKA